MHKLNFQPRRFIDLTSIGSQSKSLKISCFLCTVWTTLKSFKDKKLAVYEHTKLAFYICSMNKLNAFSLPRLDLKVFLRGRKSISSLLLLFVPSKKGCCWRDKKSSKTICYIVWATMTQSSCLSVLHKTTRYQSSGNASFFLNVIW